MTRTKKSSLRANQGHLAIMAPEVGPFPKANDWEVIHFVELANAIISCLPEVFEKLILARPDPR